MKTFVVFAVAAMVPTGCAWLRTPYLLETLNSQGGSSTPPPRPAVEVRLGRLVRTHLADSYFEPVQTAAWMADISKEPSPLLDLIACLKTSRTKPEPCYRAFDKSESSPSAPGQIWKLPALPRLTLASYETTSASPSLGGADVGARGPTAGADSKTEASTDLSLLAASTASGRKEIDVERLLANVRSIASSVIAFEDILGRALTDVELRGGLSRGIDEARKYILARTWKRDVKRPTTAIVMSGGAATGAFTAGFVSRALEVLDGCHHAKDATGATVDTCPSARVDLAVGTSTGSLIGVLVDLFHTPGREATARQLLVSNYTCVTEKDLYCVHDAWDTELAKSMRGLVRFDGIQKKLQDAMSLGTANNPTEFVGVSVEFDSGDIYAQSDEDPVDAAALDGRVQSVLASIVEPVMADPVDGLPLKSGKLAGTFIDGGVRSGLPMLEAVHRGAERTLVIATGSVDPNPKAHAASALDILLRTIDLATDQPIVGEVQQAEMSAVVRRLVEYKVCKQRLGGVASGASASTVADVEAFCRRNQLFPPVDAAPEAAVATYVGPQLFEEVARSWKSEWVYRPETGGPSAVGYSFDPRLMRELFKQGVRTFQQRCEETLTLFSVPSAVRNGADVCKLGADEAAARAEKTFTPIDQCHPDDHKAPVCQ